MNDTGSIFFHRKFEFSDGEIGEKLIIVLGNVNNNVVIAKTTSKQHGRGTTYGCQPNDRFHNFYLPKGSCYFNKCTWICLDEFFNISDSQLLSARLDRDLTHCANLSKEQLLSLQLCALESMDITEQQELIIKQSLIKLENTG